MSGTLLAGGAAAALFVSTLSGAVPVSEPTSTVPDEKIQVGVVTVNGSGCPVGTAAVAVSPDNTAFTVTYSDYLAVAGVGAQPTDFRKNCQLNLSVRVPHGFTYAIAGVDYRGYAYLAEGATATQKAHYYFQAQENTASSSHRISGPYDNNWRTADRTEVGELVWAPCGETRNFNVNTELRVDGGESADRTTSFIAMDSTDGAVNTVYRLAWRKCES
ncbi:DUF4360 domain-containing protein [Streptomyces sp. TRM43335]|uniref:DUF4360 domain-containing protein n=1 Tax=Streptomyces taklimakanensis TaxID=2569853 RepID=A0A6G2B7G2_9ACTN|nr:DUF4360 domain-containing protein [Streptomyces taklimakanensis]MTE18013.1 DUF4360 domain-containing protein [Streptomyces taklimakanensis]